MHLPLLLPVLVHALVQAWCRAPAVVGMELADFHLEVREHLQERQQPKHMDSKRWQAPGLVGENAARDPLTLPGIP